HATKPERKVRWKTILGAVASIAIVVGIFAWAIPKFADYNAVLDALGTLTSIEFWTLFAAMIFNLLTYWWANQAALPGLGIGKAAVLTQTTTSVANTLPAGGAIAIGLTYAHPRLLGVHGNERGLVSGRDRTMVHLHQYRAFDDHYRFPI